MARGRVGLNQSAFEPLRRGFRGSPESCSWAGCHRGGSRSNQVPNLPWEKKAQKPPLLGRVLGAIKDLQCWSQREICPGFCGLEVEPICKARCAPGQGLRWLWGRGKPRCSFGAALGLSRTQQIRGQCSHGQPRTRRHRAHPTLAPHRAVSAARAVPWGFGVINQCG